jgi:hypothetical protein
VPVDVFVSVDMKGNHIDVLLFIINKSYIIDLQVAIITESELRFSWKGIFLPVLLTRTKIRVWVVAEFLCGQRRLEDSPWLVTKSDKVCCLLEECPLAWETLGSA